MSSCFCVGPQNGDPVCPCEMRSITVVNGRYVKTQDLGPAKEQKTLRERMLEASAQTGSKQSSDARQPILRNQFR